MGESGASGQPLSPPGFLVRKSAHPCRVAFLGSYVPRLCGIATFTNDLVESLIARFPELDCMVGAVNDQPAGLAYPARVKFEIQQQDEDSYRRAADFLNFSNVEVLCLQHEYGLYGGRAGGHVLSLLREARMPVVTTLHTVLDKPDPRQKAVMDEILDRSSRVVVMARKGAEILREVHGFKKNKLEVIPHGIPALPMLPSEPFKEQFGVLGKRVLLTFGLLGPGKGIEDVILALPDVLRDFPDVVYLILGATHPHLLAKEGERYRIHLQRLAEDNGVRDNVIFYNRFVTPEDLRAFIGATDIYVTPYPNEAQITSGTLARVFGAGKAVVSTPYWHAVELLSEGRGVLVPFRNPSAIAGAVRGLLAEPARLESIGAMAHAAGRQMTWDVVAGQYLRSFARACAGGGAFSRATFGSWTLARRPLALPPARLGHVDTMTDDTGMLQHATQDVPNYLDGYCTDDNARALLLTLALEELGGYQGPENLFRMSTSYLAFLMAAWNPDKGRFRNFMSYDRRWLEDAGSDDSHGRALWALGTAAAQMGSEGRRELCQSLFKGALPAMKKIGSPRSWAFALLGLHAYLARHPRDEEAVSCGRDLVRRLLRCWSASATENWPWFETAATYDNARLPQALLIPLPGPRNPSAEKAALTSLRWLSSIQTTREGNFRPIGSEGFYHRDGGRADFDQQPLEALAMISACHEARRQTGDEHWAYEAKRAFAWFLGRNDAGLPLVDFSTGACADGLHTEGISRNQGAESTLAFQMALAEMHLAEQYASPAIHRS